MKKIITLSLFLTFALLVPDIELESSAYAANPVATENLQRQARQFLSIVRETKQFSDDLQINTYVIDIAKKLVEGGEIDIDLLHYYVVKDPEVNAFAGPGSTFFLNSGLIDLASNEAELASVMAHELAHFKQDHLERLLGAYEATHAPSVLAVLAGLLIGGDAGIAAIVSSQAARVDSILAHTLAYEREADNFAVRMMANSGYDPSYAKDFMVALERDKRQRGVIESKIHNTHPVTPQRIAAISARLRPYSNRQFPELTSDFLYFKARNQVFFNWQPAKTYLHFEKNLTNGTEEEQSANRYGYALSLAKDGNLEKARKELAELALLHPENLWVILAQAEMTLNDDPQLTISMLEPLATQQRPHPAVIEIYTKAMLESGHADQANLYLRKHLSTNAEHIQLLKLNAKTAAESGSTGEAYLADADYHFKLGDLNIALGQLKYAEQNSSDFYTVSIARERIRVVSNELRWRAY